MGHLFRALQLTASHTNKTFIIGIQFDIHILSIPCSLKFISIDKMDNGLSFYCNVAIERRFCDILWCLLLSGTNLSRFSFTLLSSLGSNHQSKTLKYEISLNFICILYFPNKWIDSIKRKCFITFFT